MGSRESKTSNDLSKFKWCSAVLDYNHPLVGKPLVVQLKILKVENP